MPSTPPVHDHHGACAIAWPLGSRSPAASDSSSDTVSVTTETIETVHSCVPSAFCRALLVPDWSALVMPAPAANRMKSRYTPLPLPQTGEERRGAGFGQSASPSDRSPATTGSGK